MNSHQFHGGDCVECCAEMLFSRCVKSGKSGDGILCGSAGFECKLVWVPAGWDVVFDVLENQFFKALHQNGGECHRVVVV